jgi:hypothetical protein
VHFVDQVHLVAAARGGVLRVLDQLADVVDAGVAGGVDFQQVHRAALVDLAAGGTDAAGIGAHALIAVESLGNNARQRGLADAARSREQDRRMQPVLVERMRQRAHHMLLPHHLVKAAGTVLAGQREIAHEKSVLVTPKRRERRRGKACEFAQPEFTKK